MQLLQYKKRQHVIWLSSLLIVTLLLVGCGGGSTSTASSNSSYSMSRSSGSSNKVSPDSPSLHASSTTNTSNQKTTTSDVGPQYLIKTLNVDMQVKDTRNVASSIQTWITSTDPRSSSSGTNYQQSGDNAYTIALSFSVQASIYPQIYQYLRDYTTHNDGKLVKFNETVQDVTNTYVDTQSRIQNLRVEQGRLQDLLKNTQNLNDILTIQQKLSDVEGQIESDEAQFNTLTSQVTFYTISINLEPTVVASPPPAQSENSWSIGQIFHDAFAASLSLGEGLLSFVVWLLAFSLYIVPIGLMAWFARRWYRRSIQPAQPKVAIRTEE